MNESASTAYIWLYTCILTSEQGTFLQPLKPQIKGWLVLWGIKKWAGDYDGINHTDKTESVCGCQSVSWIIKEVLTLNVFHGYPLHQVTTSTCYTPDPLLKTLLPGGTGATFISLLISALHHLLPVWPSEALLSSLSKAPLMSVPCWLYLAVYGKPWALLTALMFIRHKTCSLLVNVDCYYKCRRCCKCWLCFKC